MKKLLLVFSMLSFLSLPLKGQTTSLKNEVIAIAKKGNYSKAIKLLQKAELRNPNDAEIYFYLGVFMHYQAYDSIPLKGYDTTYTHKILSYFDKAIELKPGYGNAYYFLGAQYGAIAIDALQNGNIKGFKSALKKGYDSGGYPAWLVEYDKNVLRSCAPNAILFVGGDAEFDPIQYLQAVENYRKDITVITFAFLNRPWYVKILKTGLHGILRKAPLNMTDKQIMNLHPYKWDTLTVNIPISNKLKKEYKLSPGKVMKWKIVPGLKSESHTFLSAKRAMLLNIIRTNKWKRPVYFSRGLWPSFYAGLENHFQTSGVVSKLLPIITDSSKYEIDASKIAEVLLNKNNVKYFCDVNKHNMPGTSSILLNYYGPLYQLAAYYKKTGQQEKIKELIEFMKNNLIVKELPPGKNNVQIIEKLMNN